MDKVGARIRQERERRGLSISELARMAGVSAGAISRHERGDRMPGSAMLAKIAAALGVSTGDLLAPDVGVSVNPPTAPSGYIGKDGGVVPSEVLEAVQIVVGKMPVLPAGGRARVLRVIQAVLGESEGQNTGQNP